MIIAAAPENYADTKVFQALQAKSTPNDELASKAVTFLNAARNLQDLIIAGPFRDYTLHNPNHSKKLMHLAGYIIPDETLAQLSALELCVLVMSFYLHDLGLVVTQTERQRIVDSNEFINFIQINTGFYNKIDNIRKKISEVSDAEKIKLETELFQVTEAAMAEYLRPQHATRERYLSLIAEINAATGRLDLMKVGDVSFADELIQVCISHNLDSSALIQTSGMYQEAYPREAIINGFALNMQYCSAVLRLVDILDFDRERTPMALFNSLGIQSKGLPGFEISLKEWNKHLAIHTIRINSDEIIVSGDSRHPTIEKSIREFCAIIENEIRQTHAIVKQNTLSISQKYQLIAPAVVRSEIRSINYVYKDFFIKINGPSIVNLLMGENLYIDSQVAARELIQNSIDACNVRKEYEEIYSPEIHVSVFIGDDNRRWLRVKDNGVGMDEYVLSNFFLKVGSSYYGSQDFKQFSSGGRVSDFTPISRFGIGLISIFMIGEAIRVTTKNNSSLRGDTKERTLLIDNTDSLAVVTERLDGEQGTTVDVLLKPEYNTEQYITKLIGFIKANIIRPQIPVYVTESSGNVLSITSDNFIKLSSKVVKILEGKNVELVQVDLMKFSNILKGKAFFIFFKQPNNTLSYIDGTGEMTFGVYPLKENYLFNNFLGGSRITVNGMAMKLKRIGSLYKINKKTTFAVVIDVEVKGVQGIEYDVSRDKLFGQGLIKVRNEVFEAVEKGLKERGVFDRLDEETKLNLEKVRAKSTPTIPLDKDLLNKIVALLPVDEIWPEGIHRVVANTLAIDSVLCRKHITAALHLGLVTKPGAERN